MHHCITCEERDSTPVCSGFAGMNASVWHFPPGKERSVGILVVLQLTILSLIELKAQKPWQTISRVCHSRQPKSACLKRTGVIFIYLEKVWFENNHFQLIHCVCYLLPQKTHLACSEEGKSSVPTASSCRRWGGGGGTCIHPGRCNPTRQLQKG